jgi:molecular chaperone GrpE
MDKIKKTKKKSVSKKTDKAQEYLFGWQRTQADFENYKKQTEKRMKDIIEFGNVGLLLDLLPLFNHFKSALKHIPEEQKEEGWSQGLGHIKKLWEDLFAKFNVVEIKTVGEEFNHNEHEAIEFEEDLEKKDHEIIKEIQAGYKLNDKIIQPAKVVVNKINKE